MTPDLSPDSWAHIRYAYEHTDRPIGDICVEHGISSGTLRDRMRRWHWKRRRPPISRDGPPAAAAVPRNYPPLEGDGRRPATPDLVRGRCEPGWADFQAPQHHPTPPVFAGAQTVDPPPPGEGEAAAADERWSDFQSRRDHPAPLVCADAQPADPLPPKEGAEVDAAAIVPRLRGAVARVLPAIEATIARLAAGAHHPREMEQAGRALSALTRTLRELNTLLSQHNTRAADPYDDDIPEDIDAFRDALARRIDAFVASRMQEEEEAKREET